jgi:CO/xanthine dehydrogenase Mo-binding subunit
LPPNARVGAITISPSNGRGLPKIEPQATRAFFDDLKLADQLYATIVRSPHAHADIAAADTRAALKTAVVVRGQHWRRKWLQVP